MLIRFVLMPLLCLHSQLSVHAADDIWQVFYQRQYTAVKTYIVEHDDVDAQLLDITLKVLNEDRSAEQQLESLQKNFRDNAKVFHVAAGLWRMFGQRAGLFSKKRYYELSVSAYIKAGELAPDNARYRADYVTAKAYNGSFFSVDLSAQRAALDTMTNADPRYVLIAEMDYAQNDRDKVKAMRLVRDARERFAGDIDVMERAGQLLWTNDELAEAQSVFASVCQLPAGSGYLWQKWLTACELSAMFAQKNEASLPVGLASSQRIMDIDTVYDDYYADNMLVHAELLQKSGKHSEARAALNRIAQLPASKETLKQMQIFQKKWK